MAAQPDRPGGHAHAGERLAGVQAEPSTRIHADPPGLARWLRRALPARGDGAVPVAARAVRTRLRPRALSRAVSRARGRARRSRATWCKGTAGRSEEHTSELQ